MAAPSRRTAPQQARRCKEGESSCLNLFHFQAPWFWFIVAGLLLIGELLSPGVFLMWLAGAAAFTGLADMLFAISAGLVK